MSARSEESGLPPFGGDEARSPYERARAVVLPVPYEGTVSYGHGTSLGPEAILRASTQVELYDEQLAIEPYRAGIFTDRMLDVRERSTQDVVARVKRRVGELMDDGKWVVLLGGEHSITPGAVAAAAERHEGLHVVQLDAHADLRQSYEGSRFSHACAMARCVEIAPVTAVGIRNYSREEADWIQRGISGYTIVHGWEMEDETWIERVVRGVKDRNVYLTFDLDYFDPAILPATGTPEPGGGTWWPTLRFLGRLFESADVVAADVVELAPIPGLHHADFLAARLVHRMIGLATR
jgi:agmatinase